MKTLARVAGGIGALLTLTSALTFFVADLGTFAVKLGVGVSLVMVWAIIDRDSQIGRASCRERVS
jgi:hypothetical protein